MKKYCIVNEIKPERLEDYVNAHLHPWDELLECLKAAGTKEEYIFMLGNKALVFVECEDMMTYTEKFGIPARAVQKAQGRMPEHMRGMAKQNFYFLCFDQKSMCPN